jgi:hypothetical protein
MPGQHNHKDQAVLIAYGVAHVGRDSCANCSEPALMLALHQIVIGVLSYCIIRRLNVDSGDVTVPVVHNM